MNLSDQDWIEIVAQLRHRLLAYRRRAPWLFRGITVDDAIQESIARYLSRTRPDIERSDLTRLLFKISHDLIVDSYRKALREGSIDDLPPELVAAAETPWLKIVLDQVVGLAVGNDRALWQAFRRLSEGPMTVSNQQVAEVLNVPKAEVVRFKERAKRALRRILGHGKE